MTWSNLHDAVVMADEALNVHAYFEHFVVAMVVTVPTDTTNWKSNWINFTRTFSYSVIYSSYFIAFSHSSSSNYTWRKWTRQKKSIDNYKQRVFMFVSVSYVLYFWFFLKSIRLFWCLLSVYHVMDTQNKIKTLNMNEKRKRYLVERMIWLNVTS